MASECPHRKAQSQVAHPTGAHGLAQHAGSGCRSKQRRWPWRSRHVGLFCRGRGAPHSGVSPAERRKPECELPALARARDQRRGRRSMRKRLQVHYEASSPDSRSPSPEIRPPPSWSPPLLRMQLDVFGNDPGATLASGDARARTRVTSATRRRRVCIEWEGEDNLDDCQICPVAQLRVARVGAEAGRRLSGDVHKILRAWERGSGDHPPPCAATSQPA